MLRKTTRKFFQKLIVSDFSTIYVAEKSSNFYFFILAVPDLTKIHILMII